MKVKKSKTLILYLILRILVIAAMIIEFFERDYYGVFLCVLTLILFLIPFIVDKHLNIKLPTLLECLIFIFIFSAEILGEVSNFYLRFPYWDSILHTLNGFIMAGIGLAMIDILNQSPSLRFNMSPIFVALVAFCFSMTIGVLWEFFEYGMDRVTQTDMQKDTICQTLSSVSLNPSGDNQPYVITDIEKTVIHGNLDGSPAEITVKGYLDPGLSDTMEDLAVNCIGAVAFSFFGVFYLKGRNKIASSFIPKIKGKEENDNEH